MKLAIIDLGTNTFNILIVDIDKNKPIKHLYNTKVAVMLGRGGLSHGVISNETFSRAFNALINYRKQIDKFNCEKVVAYGTSAIRSAKNSNEFIARVKNELDIEIQSISGDLEAEFIYHGVKQVVKFTDDNYLILDIGGGSNEFIIANKNKLLWKHSFPIGGARLLEKFKPNDPITEEEISNINQYLNQQLKLLKKVLAQYPVTCLIGSSGAFDSYVEIIHHLKFNTEYDNSMLSNNIVLNDFNDLYAYLIKSTKSERLIMPGLDNIRVDTIVMALIFTKYIIDFSEVTGIIQSVYSLKEGVAAVFKAENPG